MPNIGPLELLFLGVLLVLLFGPKRLPEIARSIGRSTREFKETISGTGIDEAISGVNEVRSMASPTNLAKAAMPAPVKEMAAGVTEMKETFTDPLGMKKKDEPAEGDADAPADDGAKDEGATAAASGALAAASTAPSEAPASPQD